MSIERIKNNWSNSSWLFRILAVIGAVVLLPIWIVVLMTAAVIMILFN